MKRTKIQLFISIFELVVGLLAVLSFVLVIASNEGILKWIGTLILSIGFVVMGSAGIISYIKNKNN